MYGDHKKEDREIISKIKGMDTKLRPSKLASCFLYPDQIYQNNKQIIQFATFVLFLWMFSIGQSTGFYFSEAGKFLFFVFIATGPIAFLRTKFIKGAGWLESIMTGIFVTFFAAVIFYLFMTSIVGLVVLMTTIKGNLGIMELMVGSLNGY